MSLSQQLQQFFTLYGEGKAPQGLAQLFPHHQQSLEATPSLSPFHRALSHYGHSLAYGTFFDGLLTGRVLYEQHLSHLPPEAPFTLQLKEDLTLLQVACLQGDPLQRYLQGAPLQGAAGRLSWIRRPQRLEELLKEKQGDPQDPFSANCHDFSQRHPTLYRALQKRFCYLSRPFYPLIHPVLPPFHHFPSQKLLDLQGSALLFLQPYQQQWEWICSLLKETPTILYIPHLATLYQCRQFPPLKALMDQRKNLLYFPFLYPTDQLRAQPAYKELCVPFHPHGHVPFRGRTIAQELQNLLPKTPRKELVPSPPFDHLYALTKESYYHELAENLGSSRFPSLYACRHNQEWSEPHQGKESTGDEKSWEKRMTHFLSQHIPLSPRRPFQSAKKIRLAHVMPQMVEGGHSPSKILMSLMAHHDQERYTRGLFVTERLLLRPQDYPINRFTSLPSTQRGAQRLQTLKEEGVAVFVDEGRENLETTARTLARNLSQWKADVVVFHGHDPIHLIAARCCEAPLKVFFEHGTLPQQGGFDLILSSTTDGAKKMEALYRSLGSVAVALPFGIDAYSSWDPLPPQKSQWGVPEEGRILTTISNHLASRLTPQMLQAIGEILQRCPQAYYLPMGPVLEPEKLLAPFKTMGVENRVRLLGTQSRPSQMARAMDLYLNEFPFGSCIGMLEAMAAGCPPVSMHDPHGPTQARYGGDYFGTHATITSLDPKDYVELACKLLEDPHMYQEWSQRAREVYTQQGDVKGYVKRLEGLIEKQLHSLACVEPLASL